MLARLKQMLIKEFIQVFRDKRTRFVLFGPPIIQMLIFGYAATFEIRHVPTVVLDQDHSQESRDLISRLSSTPYFDVKGPLTDQRQIPELIDQGKATDADTMRWRGVLVWRIGTAIRHPDDPSRRVLFQHVPEAKTVKNRVHLDVRVGGEQREAEVARLVANGATELHRGAQGPYTWVTLADPEGNELCLT